MLYGGAIFLAAFLLFLVEPMAAKQLLPAFGGSAAVWLTCLVFFQTALLAGYAYAHWLARALAASGGRWLFTLLCCCAPQPRLSCGLCGAELSVTHRRIPSP